MASTYQTTPRDPGPHSRACGIKRHPHGSECSKDCPTCGGSVFQEDTVPEPERTRRVVVSAMTTTGHSLKSDPMDMTDEQLDTTRSLLHDWEDLNYLTIETGGAEVTFNLRYLVSVTLHFEDD